MKPLLIATMLALAVLSVPAATAQSTDGPGDPCTGSWLVEQYSDNAQNGADAARAQDVGGVITAVSNINVATSWFILCFIQGAA